MSDTSSFSRTTRILHWAVAAALFGMISLGLWVASLPSGPLKTSWVQTHKSFGMLTAALLILRLGWRMREGWPRHPAASRIEDLLARGTQTALLLLTLLMPLTGIMASITYARPIAVFGFPVIPKLLEEKHETWNAVAGTAHACIAYAIIALVALHIAGALRHHFILGDATLDRMMGRRGDF
jgi:cytochrome b561